MHDSRMEVRLDHIVVAARTLAEGAQWLEERLGVPLSAGGRHEVMGTHNRLLSLGPGRYLELIAVDPEASPPARPRWFDLDAPAMQRRLEMGPALITWAVRADDIEAVLGPTAAGRPEVLPMARGAYRWRIGVPPSGALAQAGTLATVIQWQSAHPAAALPDCGCRLEKLWLHHPDAPVSLRALRAVGLDAAEPVEARSDGPEGLSALISTPRGVAEIHG